MIKETNKLTAVLADIDSYILGAKEEKKKRFPEVGDQRKKKD